MDSIIRLPGGFRYEGQLVKQVELRELSGFEEDILTSSASGKTGTQRMTDILSRCTVRIGQKSYPMNAEPERASPAPFQGFWSKAFCGDRGYATVQLRRLSLGDKYKFNDMCPFCKSEIQNLTADLGQLQVDPYFQIERDMDLYGTDTNAPEGLPDDIKAAKAEEESKISALLLKDTHDIVTPGGVAITYRLLTADDEDSIANIAEGDVDSGISHLMVLHIKQINGQAASARSVKMLPSRERRWLQGFFDKVEGGVNTMLDIQCPRPKCNATYKRKLNTSKPSFFFPSEI